MSEEAGRLTVRNSGRLLERILNQPNLVTAVQSLPARALGKLIEHVGLEDAGEIVALSSTSQLKAIFDEDLWRSQSPGKDETFDADRFALWLEVMLEAGEEFAAAKLAELPEDLVTLAFHKQVLVIDIEELAVAMSSRASEHPDDEDLQVEKALESCLAEELGEYRIISRRHESWDTLFGLLVALDRDHHDYLQRLLDRLCALDAAFIEDSGGLCNVLSDEESLEADVGAEREDRRAQEGYIAPSSAAAFLALARTSKLDEIVASQDRDPISKAYFRQLRDVPEKGAKATSGAKASHRAVEEPSAEASDLLVLLQEADVLPPARLTNLLEGTATPEVDADAAIFTTALRELAAEAREVHALRLRELAYLANVLSAGCGVAGRSMRPVEAARAAVSTCNLGLQYVLQGRAKPPALALKQTSADKLFRIGWNVLFHDVIRTAAETAKGILSQLTSPAAARAMASLRSSIAAGKPWLASRALEVLEDLVDDADLATLSALLDECPSLAGKLSTVAAAESEFIATKQQVEAAQQFLERLSGVRPRD
jgi:hypothetical protein